MDQIDPPDWWAGLPSPMLLLHGVHLRDVRLGVQGNGVTLAKAQVSANGHYAFLWLQTDKAGPQQLRVLLSDGTTNLALPFTLAARTPAKNAGFSSADAMYLIFTDRFADGDTSNDGWPSDPFSQVDRANPTAWHGGDYRGIIEHEDYLQQLGVDTIWITPAYENAHEPHAYHGYDATDMYAVDPHFGTLEDYRNLSDTLHARGMKLVLDLVPNHVGAAHIWANDPPTPSWFHGTPAEHLRAQSNFKTIVDPQEGSSAAVTEGWFANSKPDLNQDDPLVSQYLIQNAIWWIEKGGLDGFRLDTFPYVQRTFWHDFHKTIHELYPHFTTVGEIFNHDPEITSFFAGGAAHRGVDTGLDTPFDFPMFTTLRNTLIKGAPMSDISALLKEDKLYPHPERLVPFLGNHDTGRFLSEPGATIDELKMGYALLVTMRGMPELYAGDEIAMRGGKDPDNRHDFPGGFPGDAQDAFTLTRRTAEQQDMYATVSSLLHFRAEHPAILHGGLSVVSADKDTLVYLRAANPNTGCASGDERLLIVANRSNAPTTIGVPLTSALRGCTSFKADLGEGSSVVTADRVTLHVPAMTVGVFTVR
ncbi:MAG TPA: alpha-amylase family glycosyl hydrolase [Acidobacteriaceae bacterium]|nr:alpha-amylase family glycosyl hydrolase [Acidobacteriaceae bacterium]